MKTQLTKLHDRNILISDEEIKQYDFVYHEKYGLFHFDVLEQGNISNQCKKIIAGLNELPQIDYSELSKEDLDRLSIVVEYDYDAVGEMKIKDALKAFRIKHGYDLSTKEDRSNGRDYLEFNSYGIIGDKVSLLYIEDTIHDSTYSVEFEVPLIDESYPKRFRHKGFDEKQFTFQDMVELVQSMCGAPSHISDESAKGMVERFIKSKKTINIEVEFDNDYEEPKGDIIIPKVTNNSIKILKVL